MPSSARICSSTAAIARSSLPMIWRAMRCAPSLSSRRCFRMTKRSRTSVKRRALLKQADMERERPRDIGAAIEVVADPRRERRQLRADLVGGIAELLRRDAEKSMQQLFVSIAQIADRILGALVFVLQGQRRLGPVRKADLRRNRSANQTPRFRASGDKARRTDRTSDVRSARCRCAAATSVP